MQELSDGLQVVHPPQPAGAAPGSAGTVVILRRRLRKPAMLASGQQAAPAAADVPFAISTREGDGTAEVAVGGPIDGGGAEELRRELSAGSRGGVRDITVDLSGVTLLASGGVRVLHELDAQLASNGASLAIVAPSGGPARMVLDLVGLGDRVVEPART
jgi:anti-anti-sigma factor